MRSRRWLWMAVGVVLLSGCMAVSPAATPEEATVVPATPNATRDVTPEPVPPASSDFLPEESAPAGAERDFTTDFSRHTVPYDEVLSGGPPKDGIPAITDPQLVSVGDADAWLKDAEPVILVQIADNVRAYPIQVLMWHEIANDTLGDVPLAVTFCPLCNTAIAFDRRFKSGDETLVLNFGTTGRLRYSNLIMYDRQTETWWQQATGEGIAGELAGRQLDFIPASIIAWSDFKDAYPDSEVMSRDTGYSRTYGSNPYAGYDDIDSSPFIYDGPETPGELPPMARVLTVEIDDDAVAYPYATLSTQGVANDTVGGQPIAVMWLPGVASALDRGAIAAGRDVGTLVVFSRELDDQVLTFRPEGNRIIDDNTGTAWDVFGRGLSGPLADRQLAPIVGINHFWFSWAAFKPETRVYVSLEAKAVPAEDAIEAEPLDTPVAPSEPASSVGVVDQLDVDFTISVYSGSEVLGGERVLFSDVLAQGQPVGLAFWAGACPLCRRELPEVQAVYQEFGDQAIFLGLDVGAFTGLGDEAAARSLMDELGLTFPTGGLLDSAAMATYRVTGIPTTLYFKPDGELFDSSGGLVGVDVLKDQIAALIAASE